MLWGRCCHTGAGRPPLLPCSPLPQPRQPLVGPHSRGKPRCPALRSHVTCVEVNPHSQRGPRHGHEGIRLVVGVQGNAADPLVDRIQEEGANTCDRDRDSERPTNRPSPSRGSHSSWKATRLQHHGGANAQQGRCEGSTPALRQRPASPSRAEGPGQQTDQRSSAAGHRAPAPAHGAAARACYKSFAARWLRMMEGCSCFAWVSA